MLLHRIGYQTQTWLGEIPYFFVQTKVSGYLVSKISLIRIPLSSDQLIEFKWMLWQQQQQIEHGFETWVINELAKNAANFCN